jgi:hypothetical protein
MLATRHEYTMLNSIQKQIYVHFQRYRLVCSQLCWCVAVINNISTVLRMSKQVWGKNDKWP